MTRRTMPSAITRVIASTAIAALATVTLGALASPAGATAHHDTAAFCALFKDSPSIDSAGTNKAELEAGIKLLRKAARTGVPGKVRRAIRRTIRFYRSVENGGSATQLASDPGVLRAFTTIGTYVATHCSAG